MPFGAAARFVASSFFSRVPQPPRSCLLASAWIPQMPFGEVGAARAGLAALLKEKRLGRGAILARDGSAGAGGAGGGGGGGGRRGHAAEAPPLASLASSPRSLLAPLLDWRSLASSPRCPSVPQLGGSWHPVSSRECLSLRARASTWIRALASSPRCPSAPLLSVIIFPPTEAYTDTRGHFVFHNYIKFPYG